VPASSAARESQSATTALRRLGQFLWRRQNRGVTVAALAVAVFCGIGLVGPFLTPDNADNEVYQALLGSSWAHPFGTDEVGRDLFSRVVFGMHISAEIAIVTVLVAGVVGTVAGLYTGYYGGLRDSVTMRVADFLLGFPPLVLALLLAAIIGPSTLTVLVATISLSIPLFARMVRASTLAERQKEYVLAARALGASDWSVMLRTLLPSVLGVALVEGAIVAALAVQVEAALSFLGVGVPPPTPSLGSLLYDSLTYISRAPLYGVFPGVGLVLLVGSFMALAKALQVRWSLNPVSALPAASREVAEAEK
jgi:ABC-type dipeptide/oligopeptide/nickel transport system permease subunit